MSTFELILTIELGVILLFLGILVIALYVAIRKIITTVEKLQEQVTPLIEKSQQILITTQETTVLAKKTAISLRAEAEACMAAVTVTTQEIAKIAQDQIHNVQTFMDDATSTVKNQIDQFDRIASRTVSRIDRVGTIIQKDVLQPIREISAVLYAARTFLEVVLGLKRKQINQVYQDEEMFI